METVALLLLAIAAIFIMSSIKVVPQQHAMVVERLGNPNRRAVRMAVEIEPIR